MQCYLILSLVGTCSIIAISAISCPSHTADPAGTGYTEAVHGIIYSRTCPPGTVYHPTKCVCDFPPSVPLSMGPKARMDQNTYTQQLLSLFNAIPGFNRNTDGHSLIPGFNRNTEGHSFIPRSNTNIEGHSFNPGSNTNTKGHSFLPNSNSNTVGLTFIPGSNMNEFGLPLVPKSNGNIAGLARLPNHNTNTMGLSFMPDSNTNTMSLSLLPNSNRNTIDLSRLPNSNMNTMGRSFMPNSNTNAVGISLQSKPASVDKPTKINLAQSDLYSKIIAANKLTIDPTKYGLPKLPQYSNAGPALPATQTFPIFRHQISSQGRSVSAIPITGTNIFVEGHSTQENNSSTQVEQYPQTNTFSLSMPGLPTKLTTLNAISLPDVVTRVQEPTWVANSGHSQPIPAQMPNKQNSANGTTSKKESTNTSSSATNSSNDPTVPLSTNDVHNQGTEYSVNADPVPGSTSVVYTAGKSNQDPTFHHNVGTLETPSGVTSNQMSNGLTSTILNSNQAERASVRNNPNNPPSNTHGESTSAAFPANFNMFNNDFNSMQLPNMPIGASNSFNLGHMPNNFIQQNQNQQPQNSYPGKFNQKNKIGNQQSRNRFPVSFIQENRLGNQQIQNSYPGFLNQKLAMANQQNYNMFPASFNAKTNMGNNLRMPQQQFPSTFDSMRALLRTQLPMSGANTGIFGALGGSMNSYRSTGVSTWTPNRNLPWKMNMAIATSMDATDSQRESYAKEVLLNQPNLSYNDMMQLTDMI